ncbi:MAG TPA: RHS repeat-associated core domain-containing protein [Bacteroidia bacterium]|nr:RHS repeat-associated core domain-containing protein [Bacteroidia bacterium]
MGALKLTYNQEKPLLKVVQGTFLSEKKGCAVVYRYAFNGKEKDDEVKGSGNQYDYGFRIYDPRIGRFLSVDPLTKSFPWWSPYQFAGNTPIQAIDLDGLEIVYITRPDPKLQGKTTLKVLFDENTGNPKYPEGGGLSVTRIENGKTFAPETQFGSQREVNAFNKSLLQGEKSKKEGKSLSSVTSIVQDYSASFNQEGNFAKEKNETKLFEFDIPGDNSIKGVDVTIDLFEGSDLSNEFKIKNISTNEILYEGGATLQKIDNVKAGDKLNIQVTGKPKEAGDKYGVKIDVKEKHD